MSNELGATKINDLINNTADTSDNEDDEVVSNILNELEGTEGDGLNDFSNSQNQLEYDDDDDDDDDALFNTDNNIFNSSEGNDNIQLDNIIKESNHNNDNSNNIIDDETMLQENNSVDENSFIPSDMQEHIDLLKYPFIVVIVVLLVNNEFVVKHLSQIKLFITDEKINMYGYGLQAALAGLILLAIMYIMKVCLK